jgi:hypothetical protein
MDYLADENISVTRPLREGGLLPSQVRHAVFRLWLEPNDVWARMVLVHYSCFRPSNSGWRDRTAWETAFQSRFMNRIARGIPHYRRDSVRILVFLTQMAINAEGDLYETYGRFVKDALKPDKKKKPKPLLTEAQRKRKINKAAKKLGVESQAITDLLQLLANRNATATETDDEPGLIDLAEKLGVSPKKMEGYLFALTDSEEGGPWEETPPSGDEKALEIGMYSEEVVDGELIGQDGGELDAVLHAVGKANKRYEEYLDELSEQKTLGAWIKKMPHNLRRLQMSGGEIEGALRQLCEYYDKIEMYKRMLKK